MMTSNPNSRASMLSMTSGLLPAELRPSLLSLARTHPRKAYSRQCLTL